MFECKMLDIIALVKRGKKGLRVLVCEVNINSGISLDIDLRNIMCNIINSSRDPEQITIGCAKAGEVIVDLHLFFSFKK